MQKSSAASPSADVYTLKIRDTDENDDGSARAEQTRYVGHGHTPADNYILTLSEDGQTYTLDALGAEYNFNMVSAPWEQDSARLAEQYKQIPEQDEEQDDDAYQENGHDHNVVNGNADHDPDAPDPDNPYDYRHYIDTLSTLTVPSSSILPADSRAASTANTPMMRAWTGASPAPTPRPHTSNGHLSVNGSSDLRERSPMRTPQRVEKAKPKPKASAAMRKIKRAAPPRKTAAAAAADTEASSADEESVIRVSSKKNQGLGLGIDLGGGKDTGPAAKKPRSDTVKRPNTTGTTSTSKSTARKETKPVHRARADTVLEFDEGDAFQADSDRDDEDDAGYENNNVKDHNESSPHTDDDVDELELPGPVVGEPLRRQSTWDEDAEAMLQASLEEALMEQEEEEAQGHANADADAAGIQSQAAVGRKADSDSESEEE